MHHHAARADLYITAGSHARATLSCICGLGPTVEPPCPYGRAPWQTCPEADGVPPLGPTHPCTLSTQLDTFRHMPHTGGTPVGNSPSGRHQRPERTGSVRPAKSGPVRGKGDAPDANPDLTGTASGTDSSNSQRCGQTERRAHETIAADGRTNESRGPDSPARRLSERNPRQTGNDGAGCGHWGRTDKKRTAPRRLATETRGAKDATMERPSRATLRLVVRS